MATKKLVIRGKIGISGTLDSGTGDAMLTRDATSLEVGSVPAIDTSNFISTTLPSGQILVGNGSNIATPRTASGAITISNTGVVDITGGYITDAHINAAAGIQVTKLAPGTATWVLRTNAGGTAVEYVDPTVIAPPAWLLASGGTFTGPNTIIGSTTNTLTFQIPSIGTSTTNGRFLIENTTAAGAGAQQYSPPFVLRGYGWRTNATAESQSVDFYQQVRPIQSTVSPLPNWNLSYSINGGGLLNALDYNNGTLTVGNSGASILTAVGTNLTVRAGGGSMFLGANGVNMITLNEAATDTVTVLTNLSFNSGNALVQAAGNAQFTLDNATAGSPNTGQFHISSTYSGSFDFMSGMRLAGSHVVHSSATWGDNIRINRTLSSGANNQTLTGIYMDQTWTIGHTGVGVYGYRFNVAMGGAQTPAHVYAFHASTGKIGLADYTNSNPVNGDFWMASSGQPLIRVSGATARVWYGAATVNANEILYSGTTGTGNVITSANFTYDGTTHFVNATTLLGATAGITANTRLDIVGIGSGGGAQTAVRVANSADNQRLTIGDEGNIIQSGAGGSGGFTLISSSQSFSPSSGTFDQTWWSLTPTLATGGTFTGNVHGIRYAPTGTSSSTGTVHHAWVHTMGFIRWASVLSPAQITANQNDYNPTGWTNGGAPHGASILRLNTDASRNITSLTGGIEGRLAIVTNVGSFNVVLTDDDGATGTAANRFALANNLTLRPDEATLIFYDDTTDRWRAIGANATSVPLSGLTAATGTNTINNAALQQEWQWNTLSNTTGLKLSSNSTAASGGSQVLFELDLTGANSNSGQLTVTGRFANSHSGTGSINVAGYFVASSGATNYGIWINGGGIKMGNGQGNIFDVNDNELLKWSSTASAVNEITIANAATGFSPTISATGGDTDISLNIVGKGSFGVYVEDWYFSNSGAQVSGAYIGVSGGVFEVQGAAESRFQSAATASANSGKVVIRSGDVNSGVGNSGDLYIHTGASSGGGTKGNIGIGTSSVSNWQSMQGGLFVANRTADPSAAITDGIAIMSKDSSDGSANSTLSLRCEQAVEAIGTFTASHKLKIWINGTEYWIQLDAV